MLELLRKNQPEVLQILTPPTTLPEWQDYLKGLYEGQNSWRLHSRDARIAFYRQSVSEFKSMVESGAGKLELQAGAVRPAARLIAVGNGIQGFSMGLAMAWKFPESGCVYCGFKPCDCGAVKGEAKINFHNPEHSQINRSVRRLQMNQRETYFDKNIAAGGIEFIMERQDLEVDELEEANDLSKKPAAVSGFTKIELQKSMSLEIADNLAWILAAANTLNIDLQTALQERYFPFCWSCHRNPCHCDNDIPNILMAA